MSNLVYRLFNRGVKWNAFEGIFYQTILTCHQAILFSVLDNFTYGLIGVSFSVLYLSILFFNFGFDKSLAAFFPLFIKNKSLFKKIFIRQFLIQAIFLSLIFFVVILFSKQMFFWFFSKFLFDINILPILALILITESLKKSLRYVCELAFLNKQIAITEICLISSYVIFFWIGYFYLNKVNLYLVFVPHLIQSIFGVLIFSYFLINIYKTLSNEKENITLNNIKEIIYARISNYFNQLSHLLFSGNFVIPFLACIYGLKKISIFKLLNIISVYFTVILERTFGLTSGALLSHLHNLTKDAKQAALNIATNKLLIVIYAIFIFLFFNFKNFFYSAFEIPDVGIISIYLFLFSIIFENLFITMEQFFIVENKIYYFVIVNLFAAFIFYLFSSTAFFISFDLKWILLFFILTRIFCFIILRWILQKKLNTHLNYKINFQYVIYFFIFAFFFLIITKYIFDMFKNIF